MKAYTSDTPSRRDETYSYSAIVYFVSKSMMKRFAEFLEPLPHVKSTVVLDCMHFGNHGAKCKVYFDVRSMPDGRSEACVELTKMYSTLFWMTIHQNRQNRKRRQAR